MTRNNTTSYREKGRAVFLSAIMILSMVAGSAALAGSAAATAPSDEFNDQGNNNVAFNGLSDAIRYEGQSFNVTFATGGNAGAKWANEENVYLAEVDSRDQSSNIDGYGDVTTISNTSNTGGVFVGEVDLDGVDSGEYVISNDSTAVGANKSNTFSVQEQDFSINFDDDSVDDTDNASVLELNSDRPSTDYNITVSVSGPDTFDAAMIEDVFNASNGTTATVTDSDNLPLDELGYDREGGDDITDIRDDDYVTLNLAASNYSDTIGSDELELNFTKLSDDSGLPDAGEYEFEVIVTDTGATATDTISISESDTSASFSEGTVQSAAGDIATFEFELQDTDETWVQIGDESSDFVEVLYIKADDQSEPVEVSVNTRLLGANKSIGQDAVYDMSNVDSYESGFHETGNSDMTTPEDATLFGDDGADTNNYAQYVTSSLGLTDSSNNGDYDDMLTRPLQSTDYEIQIGGTDVDSDEPMFDADNGGEATDQLASAVLELQQPEIGDITIHTAPEDNADAETEIEDLVSAATPRDEVAINDRVIVQVEASGIYGALVANPTADGDPDNLDPDWDRLDDGVNPTVLHELISTTNESVDFEVVAESTTGNQAPLELRLDQSTTGNSGDSYIVLDEENEQFFYIADTSSDNAFENGDAPDEELSFTAMLEYDADDGGSRYEFETDNAGDNKGAFSAASDSTNYPYLLQGEVLSSSAELDLAPRSVEFDHVNAEDMLEAENIEASEISGTTNVAPGSDATLRVSSTDASSSFRNGQDVNITEDGTISAEFDFSDQEVEDQFETVYRVGGASVDTVDSVIVEEGSLSDSAPEEDDSTNETDTEDDTEDTEDDSTEEDSTEEDSTEEDSTDDETPGFGAIVALVALIGAALLATRRQN